MRVGRVTHENKSYHAYGKSLSDVAKVTSDVTLMNESCRAVVLRMRVGCVTHKNKSYHAYGKGEDRQMYMSPKTIYESRTSLSRNNAQRPTSIAIHYEPLHMGI